MYTHMSLKTIYVSSIQVCLVPGQLSFTLALNCYELFAFIIQVELIYLAQFGILVVIERT